MNHRNGDKMATHIQNRYSFWYYNARKQAAGKPAKEFEEQITLIGNFKSVETFWGIYNHILRPESIPDQTDIFVFKDGIKPIWEDQANSRGGQLIFRVPKALSGRCWELILLAMIGEQFDTGNELCGAVLSVRVGADKIAIWNRNSENTDAKNKIEATIKKLLNLPPSINMEYKKHNPAKSMKKGDVGNYNGLGVNRANNYRRPPGKVNEDRKPGWVDRDADATRAGGDGFVREGGVRDGARPFRRHEKTEGEEGSREEGYYERREREPRQYPRRDVYAQNWRRQSAAETTDISPDK